MSAEEQAHRIAAAALAGEWLLSGTITPEEFFRGYIRPIVRRGSGLPPIGKGMRKRRPGSEYEDLGEPFGWREGSGDP